MSFLRPDDYNYTNLYNIASNKTQQALDMLKNHVWDEIIKGTDMVGENEQYLGNSSDIDTERRYWIFSISQENNKIIVIEPRSLYIVGVSESFQDNLWQVKIFDGINAVSYANASSWTVSWDSILDSMQKITGQFKRNEVKKYVIKLAFLISEAARFEIVQVGIISLDDGTRMLLRDYEVGENMVYDIGQDYRINQLREYSNYLQPILNNYDKLRKQNNCCLRVKDIRNYAEQPADALYNIRFHQKLINLGILRE